MARNRRMGGVCPAVSSARPHLHMQARPLRTRFLVCKVGIRFDWWAVCGHLGKHRWCLWMRGSRSGTCLWHTLSRRSPADRRLPGGVHVFGAFWLPVRKVCRGGGGHAALASSGQPVADPLVHFWNQSPESNSFLTYKIRREGR